MDNPQWVIPEEVVGGLLDFPFDKGGTDGFPPPGEWQEGGEPASNTIAYFFLDIFG